MLPEKIDGENWEEILEKFENFVQFWVELDSSGPQSDFDRDDRRFPTLEFLADRPPEFADYWRIVERNPRAQLTNDHEVYLANCGIFGEEIEEKYPAYSVITEDTLSGDVLAVNMEDSYGRLVYFGKQETIAYDCDLVDYLVCFGLSVLSSEPFELCKRLGKYDWGFNHLRKDSALIWECDTGPFEARSFYHPSGFLLIEDSIGHRTVTARTEEANEEFWQDKKRNKEQCESLRKLALQLEAKNRQAKAKSAKRKKLP